MTAPGHSAEGRGEEDVAGHRHQILGRDRLGALELGDQPARRDVVVERVGVDARVVSNRAVGV